MGESGAARRFLVGPPDWMMVLVILERKIQGGVDMGGDQRGRH